MRCVLKNRTTPIVSLSILLSAVALAFMTANERYVAAPGIACVVMMLWLWMRLWDRDRKIPFFDIGVFCALATFFYAVYPLINYWVNGLQFDSISDSRLRKFNIVPAELGFFYLRYVLYLFSFVIFYSTFRGRGTIELGNVHNPGRYTRQTIVLFFLLLTSYFFFLQLATGASFNTTYQPEAYAKNLSALASLPLFLLQISNKFWGILFLFKLALLFIVVNQCRQRKWLVVLLLWVAAEIVHTFNLKGDRTGLVLFLMATALLYHRMIKPFTMRFLVVSGTALFIFFIFMGLYRTHKDLSSLQTNLSLTNAGILSGSNEFQALLGTAYDVLQRKTGGAYLPWYLYINDIITILPPQQLIPFEKVPASEWYLRELGISGTGQGYMWGVISQSIVGFDWIELYIRGALLGYILARFHRWYLKHQSGFLPTLLYVFFCIKVYYTFRDTTFSPLAFLVWEVIPFYIFLGISVTIFSYMMGYKSRRRIAMSVKIQNELCTASVEN